MRHSSTSDLHVSGLPRGTTTSKPLEYHERRHRSVSLENHEHGIQVAISNPPRQSDIISGHFTTRKSPHVRPDAIYTDKSSKIYIYIYIIGHLRRYAVTCRLQIGLRVSVVRPRGSGCGSFQIDFHATLSAFLGIFHGNELPNPRQDIYTDQSIRPAIIPPATHHLRMPSHRIQGLYHLFSFQWPPCL